MLGKESASELCLITFQSSYFEIFLKSCPWWPWTSMEQAFFWAPHQLPINDTENFYVFMNNQPYLSSYFNPFPLGFTSGLLPFLSLYPTFPASSVSIWLVTGTDFSLEPIPHLLSGLVFSYFLSACQSRLSFSALPI